MEVSGDSASTWPSAPPAGSSPGAVLGHVACFRVKHRRWSHHSADLPSRSPRSSRRLHTAAARLLVPGVRTSCCARLYADLPARSPRRTRRRLHTSAVRLLVRGAWASFCAPGCTPTCWRGSRGRSAACTPPRRGCWCWARGRAPPPGCTPSRTPAHHRSTTGHSNVWSSSRYSTGYWHLFQAATHSTDIPMRRTTIAGVSGTDRRYMAERERGRASDDRAV
jgi:hypothetical protein